MTYTTRQFAYENPLARIALAVCVASVGLAAWLEPEEYTEPATPWVLGASVLILVALFFMTVSQTVTDTHVVARVVGLFTRRIPLAEIADLEVREYRPIRQFGGWGLRFGANGSRAYTMKGKRAVVLRLTDGREVYLGARNVDELHDAIARARALAGTA